MNSNTDYEKLFELKEDTSLDADLRVKYSLLYQAMTDWPGSTDLIQDFLAEVKHFLKTDILTYSTIDKSLAGMDPGDYAWQQEALSSLRELASSDKDIAIDAIVIQILK